MSNEGLEQFEKQVAELVGAAKGLFKEFENRQVEVLSAQRGASSEARAESVKVREQLQEIGAAVKVFVERHHRLIGEIEKSWQLRIDDNAKRAGAHQAQAFGEAIAAGLRQQLAGLASEVRSATNRFTWSHVLQWSLGIAIAIPILVVVGVVALTPRVAGLSPLQTYAAIAHLVPCQIDEDRTVCVAIDEKPRLARGADGQLLVAIKGMEK